MNLGTADGSFYTMGVGGELILAFNPSLTGGATGNSVLEVTFGRDNWPTESANIFVSNVLDAWTSAGSISTAGDSNADGSVKPLAFTLPGTIAQSWKYLRFLDTSAADTNGIDIDSIIFSSNATTPVPLPIAALGGAGLLGLLGVSRRQRASLA